MIRGDFQCSTGGLKPFSDTGTLDFSRRYPEELYVGIQMSESVGPDIKQTLLYQVSSTKSG